MLLQVLKSFILILIAQPIGAAFTIRLSSLSPVNRETTNNSFEVLLNNDT